MTERQPSEQNDNWFGATQCLNELITSGQMDVWRGYITVLACGGARSAQIGHSLLRLRSTAPELR